MPDSDLSDMVHAHHRVLGLDDPMKRSLALRVEELEDLAAFIKRGLVALLIGVLGVIGPATVVTTYKLIRMANP